MMELRFHSLEFEKVALQEEEPEEELDVLLAWYDEVCESLADFDDIAIIWRCTRINDKGEEESYIDEEAWKNTNFKTWLGYTIGRFNLISYIDSLQYDIDIKISYINQRDNCVKNPSDHERAEDAYRLISHIIESKTNPNALDRLYQFFESLGYKTDDDLNKNVLDRVLQFVDSHEYKSDKEVIEAMDERDRIWNEYVRTMTDVEKHRSIIAFYIYLKDDELINTFPVSCMEILQQSIDFLQAALDKGVSNQSEHHMMRNMIYDGIRIALTSSVVML